MFTIYGERVGHYVDMHNKLQIVGVVVVVVDCLGGLGVRFTH
jgi:hypothetical protein